MLAGKRAVRVGDQLLKALADLLITRVSDPRLKGVTFTGINLSRDLKHAKVYYSMLDNNEEKDRVQKALERAKGFLKREIGFRVELKYMPELFFIYDPTLESGNYMDKLLDKIKKESNSGEENEQLS